MNITDNSPTCVLITGAAGFIGYHLSQRLLSEGHKVIGLDNLNRYYDPILKQARLERLKNLQGFEFVRADLENKDALLALFEKNRFDVVVNLAAQAGVRYSLVNPHSYIKSNIEGFLNILESCRMYPVKHLVFASSSSVYGGNTSMPFSVHQNVDHPVSLYAATKKTNELMAHTYSHLYGIPSTGLRFFTVYGPWGRPDMALFLFTEAIYANKPIKVYNYGNMKRDFTYIDDIVEGIVRIMKKIPVANPNFNTAFPDPSSSFAPYRIYNIGNNRPVALKKFIEILEQTIGKEAQKEYLPIQPGDVPETYADIDDLYNAVGFKPKTPLEEGIKNFIEWYNQYNAA